ncbi:MAG: hypothetical protein WC678_00115 [Parcubacteria group bacterium]|jgi:hypothetical protein
MSQNPVVSAKLVPNDCTDDFYNITRADGSCQEVSAMGMSDDLKNEIHNLANASQQI